MSADASSFDHIVSRENHKCSSKGSGLDGNARWNEHLKSIEMLLS